MFVMELRTKNIKKDLEIQLSSKIRMSFIVCIHKIKRGYIFTVAIKSNDGTTSHRKEVCT